VTSKQVEKWESKKVKKGHEKSKMINEKLKNLPSLLIPIVATCCFAFLLFTDMKMEVV